MKLCTKFVVSGFIGIWDIVEGMPNFLGVTWPKQRPLSEMLYIRLMGRAKLKLCTNLELSDFTGFGDILEGMPKILGVTWPRPHPFQKYYTALFEFSGFIGFWDIVEGMPNFLGSRDLSHAPFQKLDTTFLWQGIKRRCVPNLKKIRLSRKELWRF